MSLPAVLAVKFAVTAWFEFIVIAQVSGVGVGTDHTLFAKVNGRVQFQKKGVEQRLYVSVLPEKA